MRVARLFKLCLVAASVACEGGPTAPDVSEQQPEPSPDAISFLSGDRVELEVRLQGCFHDFLFVATLLMDGDSAIVEQFRGSGNLAPGYRLQPVTALTSAQMIGFGSLLEEYRRPKTSVCTSIESGEVRVTRAGEATRVERFEGHTCRLLRDDVPAFRWDELARIVASDDLAK